MNKKGISVVSLSVTIVILLVILSTISISITYSVDNARKLTFAKEIYNIQSLVTEYVQKENVLPVSTDTIQIQPSDTEQFEGETITDEKLLLNIIDLTELDIVNTNYGNKKIGETDVEKENDIYAVSTETGKVYYIAGFRDKNKTYYTLTDDLLNMIEKKQDLLISEKTIVFTPSKLGWSNEAVSVRVTVPEIYEVTNFSINNENIKYTEETVDNIKVYNVNLEKVLEDYEITVNYTKDGTPGNVKYKTKLDLTKPSILKDETVTNTSTAIKGINATDEESGIKYFKYAEGIISDSNVKEYMKSYGRNINNGSIKMKNKSLYTFYAEDKAGNNSVLHVDGEGKWFYSTVKTFTGINKLTLKNIYDLDLINYRIYGNSAQEEYEQVEYIESTNTDYVAYDSEQYKNLYEEMTFTEGYAINQSGAIAANANYKASDYIEITPNTTYISKVMNNYLSYGSGTTNRVCCYDESKNFISMLFENTRAELRVYENLFTTPSNAKYIRASYRKTDTDIELYKIPTPNSVGNYDAKTGKYVIPINIKGKNLLINTRYSAANSTVTKTQDYYNVKTSTNASGMYFSLEENNFKVGDTISFQAKVRLNSVTDESITTSATLRIWNANKKNWIHQGRNGANSVCSTIDLGSIKTLKLDGVKLTSSNYTEGDIIQFVISKGMGANPDNNAISFDVYIDSIMVELSDKATEYEPFRVTTTNIYLEEPLRKVGSYIDYLDFRNKEVVRNVLDNNGALEGLETPKKEKLNLPELPLGKDINRISVDTYLQPSKVEAEYYEITYK